MGLSSLILKFVPQQFFFLPKMTAALLTEAFPPISFHLSVYLFLKKRYHVTPRHGENLWRAL